MTLVFAFNPEQYRSPQRVWDGDERRYLDAWETQAPFEVYLNDGRKIVVPKGFVYDKGSVPRLAWGLIPRDDRAGVIAFLVHDYLYESKMTTRKEADQIMYELLRLGGMSWLRAQMAHKAVRMAVWNTW